ncbi:MAG TPA: CHAT domain-containing tetratricopeptide repeat protein [Pyrinomonadaceae bacterium]|nr:CHAT domain-containing tetratricopeptide repeat protein [Pyrinomonadaceae bacterium]
MKMKPSQFVVQFLAILLIGVAPVFAQTPGDLPTLAAVERELKGGETQSYRIVLAAGQFLHAVVEQKDIDVVTAVFGPDGKQLTESNSPNDRWGTEAVILVASVPGEYRVDVRSPNNNAQPGRYEIKIIALREATAIDKGHAAAQAAFDEARKLRFQQTAASRQAAIEKCRQALPLFEAAGDTYRRALTLMAIGIAYYPMNEFRKALDYFNQTLAIAIALGDKRLEAGTETFIGGMLDFIGDVGKALDHYHHAHELAREGGWRLAEGNALSNIGKIYNDAADWEKALEFYGQALRVFVSLGSKENEALALNNIGIAYSQSGEYLKALDYLQQSLPLIRASNDKFGEAYTLLNIGRTHRRLGAYAKALSYFNEAQAIQQATGNRGQEAETLDEIGRALSEQGQNQKAVEYHQQAIQIQRKVGNVRREAAALTNLGEVYNLLEQPDKAQEQFTQALSMFRNIGDPRGAARVLEGIARAEHKRGNFEAAHKNIAESLTLIETVRSRSGSLQLRASYRATVERAYEFYIDLLMQQHAKSPAQGFDAEALSASERGRARSLLEKLSEAPIDIRQGIDPALIEKERDLKRVMNAKAQREMTVKARNGSAEEIATLQREISALEDEYQQVQSAIRKSSPQYSALTQPQPLDLKGIQQQLEPNTLLLEYSLGEERSYVWVVSHDSLKTYILPKREDVESVSRRVVNSLTARSVVDSLESPNQRRTRIALADAEFQRTATELSRMIVAPASAAFGNKRLVVVAGGALQYVPFAALPVARNRPLIVDHELVSLQSASAFAVQRQNLANRPLAPKAVAVIADPVFSTNDTRLTPDASVKESASTRIIEHGPGGPGGQLAIPRLPFTRSEADEIFAVSPAGSSLKVVGFNANRAIASSGDLSKYRYVHFATHGYLDTTRAGLSAVVLSMFDKEGKPQDGFLRTHDIYNLKLPAELVVLSACETGLGKDVTGEGLEGLTRAFMYAGARRVVVSLWNVNDKATASLMQRLYAGMLRGDKTPAAALRAAQIEMLRTRQWQSPYFWAAFVMQGEWK